MSANQTVSSEKRASERATLTVEEAARILGIGRASAYNAAKSGDLPTVRIGGRLLVPRARLTALLGEDLQNDNDPAGNRAEVTTSADLGDGRDTD